MIAPTAREQVALRAMARSDFLPPFREWLARDMQSATDRLIAATDASTIARLQGRVQALRDIIETLS